MAIMEVKLVALLFLPYVYGYQVNVAFKKTASTTTGIFSVWYPSGAVDGDHTKLSDHSSCFHAATSPSDWTVDLGQEYQLYHILVYLRRGFNDRTANSIIYLDNNSSRVCYTFPSTISDNPTSLICNQTVRYVTIRNPGNGPQHKDALNICEVEIYACSNRSYGLICNNDCKCSLCNRWTGVCYSDCDVGYHGDYCDIACNGTYGVNCNKSCEKRMCDTKSQTCDVMNGACEAGCLPGWNGTDCTKECTSFTYGENCSKDCASRHCAGKTSCNHVTGSCDQNCTAGWKGVDCTEGCDEHHYGPNCAGECYQRHCEGNSSCNSTTGRCDGGCQSGWSGTDCKECNSSHYGENCANSCAERHCAGSSSCDHLTGSCDKGCESGWGGPACMLRARGTNNSQPSEIIIGAGVAAGVVILLLLVIAIIVLTRKRRKKKRSSNDAQKLKVERHNQGRSELLNVYENVACEEDKGKPEEAKCASPVVVIQLNKNQGKMKEKGKEGEEEMEVEIEEEDQSDPSSYYNLNEVKASHVIPIDQLEENEKELPLLAEEEFKNLPSDFLHPYDESQMSRNKGKNRFKGYYPYNYNRVVLLDTNDDRRDYINASYMDGFKSKNRFIAAQGPYRIELLEDFWRMIWQEGTKTIVMVTGLVEEGKVKCLQYWPETGTQSYGDITVTMETKAKLAYYTVTNLLVHHGQESKKRLVKHFHFTSWPDHDVPNTSSLLTFMRRINTTDQQENPMVVHCSAGIGRTGTYIAVDNLVNQATTEGVVDVVSCVTKMRGQRRNMVQTKEQYVFIYRAVTEAVSNGDTSLDTDTIKKMDLGKIGTATMGKRTVDRHLEILNTSIEGDGSSENLIRLSSYRNHSGFFLITSHPDKEEMWNDIYNTGARSLITWTDDDRNFSPTPESPITTSALTVTLIKSSVLSDDVTLHTVELTKESDAAVIKVHHYYLTRSVCEQVPSMMLLVDNLLQWTRQPDCETSIIVSSSVSESRLLVLLVNIASRLQDDGKVDVISNMRRLQEQMAGPPFNVDDVAHCLDFARRCLESVEMYANL